MASPDRFYRLRRHGTRCWHLGQLPSVGASESQAIVRVTFDLVSLLVDRAVMPSTEQRQVGERCRATLRPVVKMMALGDPNPAAGEAAAPVPLLERSSERRRDGPGSRPDLHHASLAVVPQHHPARVARQALGRFRGNADPVFQHRLPRLRRIRQHRGIHVHHHLVALARGSRVQTLMQCRLRHEGERIRLLLGSGRWLRRWVRCADRPLLSCSLIEHLTAGLERAP